MGGARSKVTLEDARGLWIGKFPAKDARCNLQRLGSSNLDLARHNRWRNQSPDNWHTVAGVSLKNHIRHPDGTVSRLVNCLKK